VKVLRKIGQVTLSICVLVIGLLIVRWAWTVVSGLQKEVAAALVAAVAAVAVATVGRYAEQRRTLTSDLRARKTPVYEDFIAFWIDVLVRGQSKPAEIKPSADAANPTKAFVAPLNNFTKGLIIYGSDDAVATWSRYRRRFFAADAPEIAPDVDPTILLGFEDVLRSIRGEFGHRNRGLERGELLGLFINDVHKLLEAADRRKDEGRVT
jgi:hypothetical protein